MAGLKLGEKVVEHLCHRKNLGKRFTAREIADAIFRKYPKECEEKKLRSRAINTDKELVQALVSEIGSIWSEGQFKKYPQLQRSDEKPKKRYYWTGEPYVQENHKAEDGDTHRKPSSKPRSFQIKSLPHGSHILGFRGSPTIMHPRDVREHDLYPLLQGYLQSEKRVYSMRIDEKKSSNKRGKDGNNWLHPDIVGMENLTSDWQREIGDLAKETSHKKAKLWSLEVKRDLDRRNVRQAFFQAVSNSSWANFGYLATMSIKDDDTRKELDMLAALHGIGLIEINVEDTSKSRILIPARERNDFDLATCNRLSKENRDFARFIKEVWNFYLTGNTDTKTWDIRGATKIIIPGP